MAASISAVKICNMALSHIGNSTGIESLTEESSEAKTCNLWYDWTRVQVLESHNWNFAKKRLTVPLLETNPNTEWLYRYEYPSDCIKVRLIENPAGPNEDALPFIVENTSDSLNLSVLTDQEDAALIYTFDLANTNLFSSLFIDALSRRLSAAIAFTITGDRSVEQSEIATFQRIMAVAMSGNASEGMDKPERESEFIRVRA
jgi:hypothetical protein